jgi:hypothetical protein
MNQPKELDFDIAHLGHVELLTPKFEESILFLRTYSVYRKYIEIMNRFICVVGGIMKSTQSN